MPSPDSAASAVQAAAAPAALRRLADSLVAGAAHVPSALPREGAAAVALGVSAPGTPLMRACAGSTIALCADGTALDAGEAHAAGARAIGPQTLFDLASVTKVVTTLVAATLIDEQLLDPDAPVQETLEGADARIRVRHLLTHTSGLPAVVPSLEALAAAEGRPERLRAIAAIAPDAEPGTLHRYSCTGFLLLGALLEQIGGAPLPDLTARRILDPIGASAAGWGPAPDPRDCAATEYEDGALLQGVVHDETARLIGGAANAGLFATLPDVLALGGVLAGTADAVALSPSVRSLLLTDQLPDGPSTGAPWRQSFGLRIGQALPGWESAPPGAVLLPDVAGHPGFTGTALMADPRTGTVAVMLTNRVHPRRDALVVDEARRELARIAFARPGGTR